MPSAHSLFSSSRTRPSPGWARGRTGCEHRALQRAGDDRLTGSKYLWLIRPRDMTPAQRQAFRALQHQDLKAARACTL